MLSVGIGDIQKNTAILSNLTDVIQVVDKRKKQVVAMVYPSHRGSIIHKLAGKYKERVPGTELTFDEIKAVAYEEAMREKYGLSS